MRMVFWKGKEKIGSNTSPYFSSPFLSVKTQPMNSKTEDYQLNHELTLWESPQSPLGLPVTLVSLIWQDETVIECRLIFQLNLELYQQLNTTARFNLKPELRGAQPAVDFQADSPIELKVTLKPDRLPDLIPHATTAEAAAHYLLQLSQTTPDHPLLYTENWLALSVTQKQPEGEVGYTTLWNTLNPAALAAGTTTETEITQALTSFFADWTAANLGNMTETATSKILGEVGQFFDDLTDSTLDKIAHVTTSEPLLETIIHFFTEDDWQFTKIQGKPLVRLGFQGENGTWNCYAKALEQVQQFVFYSVCPVAIPADKRSPISEFLTRANYGMIIGNFEMDFNDGEIRYKTSIDVEGDRLTSALLRQLVYANVAMMDEYLPGIQAVLNGESPEAAIRSIEQPAFTPEAEAVSPGLSLLVD